MDFALLFVSAIQQKKNEEFLGFFVFCVVRESCFIIAYGRTVYFCDFSLQILFLCYTDFERRWIHEKSNFIFRFIDNAAILDLL
jgi:hypothetical protein